MTTLFDDAGVIHTYARAQAVSDGTLVEVTELAREAGFRYPVAFTRAAWADLVAWNDSNRAIQDETGRLWDVLNMARWGATRGNDPRKLMQLWRVPNTPRATAPRTATFVLHCGPGDNAEPVVTIMLGGED